MSVHEIVTWHKTFSINIPIIDAQHMELINLTNKLYRNCLKGREHSKEVFMGVLRGTVDYVGYHFSTEEKIMERVGYPAFGAHKREHTNFVREVLKSANNFSRGVNYNPIAFVKYLKDWVLTHIAVSDTALGTYLLNLKQQGTLQNITLRIKQVSDRYVYE
jgi:hemerythrin